MKALNLVVTKMLRSIVFGVAAVLAMATMAGSLKAQSNSSEFVPFQEFMAATATAASADYMSRPNSRVASAAAFDEMRQYVLTMYQGVQVEHSMVEDSQYFDCIPIGEQPSVRLLGINRIEEPPAQLPGEIDAGDQLPMTRATSMSSSFDKFGNASTCEPGTIPMRRLTLDELTHFPTLQAFLHRNLGRIPDANGAENPPVPDPAIMRRWATEDQTVNNLGGISEISLWDPAVGGGNTFSLAQQWFSGGTANGLQTVEGGWTKYPTAFNKKPHSVLFIFFTPDNYTSGCYNLDCPGFVQEDNSWKLAGEFPAYSVYNGAQHWVTMEWYLVPNGNGKKNWWLLLKGDTNAAAKWIGYYPESVFNGGQMTKNAERIVFGGETATDTDTLPPMGSGDWPANGWKKAAFHSNIKYTDTDRNVKAAALAVNQQSPNCYKVATPPVPQAAAWGSYFFFGGPGGKNCQ